MQTSVSVHKRASMGIVILDKWEATTSWYHRVSARSHLNRDGRRGLPSTNSISDGIFKDTHVAKWSEVLSPSARIWVALEPLLIFGEQRKWSISTHIIMKHKKSIQKLSTPVNDLNLSSAPIFKYKLHTLYYSRCHLKTNYTLSWLRLSIILGWRICGVFKKQ